MKTTIYFLRHGDVNNPKNILYGRMPGFTLSEDGKRQIKKLAAGLKTKGISQIYTSPILRASQTAQMIGKILGITPRISKLLIETDDVLSGIPLVQFQKEIEPKLYSPNFISMGQESIKSQEKRMQKFVALTTNAHLGQNILAVSHGDPIMILKAHIEGIPFTYRYKKEHYLQKGHYFKLEIAGNKYKFSN
jgi:broad specificity phosphatase PhoE